MPYIKENRRPSLKFRVMQLAEEIGDYGELTFVIYYLLLNMPEKNFNDRMKLMGVLSCVAHEYYRRRIAPYEEKKMLENGDIGLPT